MTVVSKAPEIIAIENFLYSCYFYNLYASNYLTMITSCL